MTVRKSLVVTGVAAGLLLLSGCKKDPPPVADQGPVVTAPLTLNQDPPVMINQTNPKSVFIPANGVAIVPFSTNISKGLVGPDDTGTVSAEGMLVKVSGLKPGATTLRVQTADGEVADFPLVVISPEQPINVTSSGDVRLVEGHKVVLSFPAPIVGMANLLNDSTLNYSKDDDTSVTVAVAHAQQSSPVLRVTTTGQKSYNVRFLVLADPQVQQAAHKAAADQAAAGASGEP